MKRMHLLFFMLVGIAFLVGCSRNVGMGGKVTFSDDHSPLPVGTVFFETDTFQARGDIKPDGTYTIGTHSEKDGLPPGTYRVFVTGAVVNDPSETPGPNKPPLMLKLIDPKFESGRTSGLTVEVDASKKAFDFSVDPTPAAKTKFRKAG